MLLPDAAHDVFRCTSCGSPLSNDEPGGGPRCLSCGLEVQTVDGVLDFVGAAPEGSERAYYDEYYGARGNELPPPPADLSELADTWISSGAPWEMERTWLGLGDLEGRRILLLGNGESYNELFMLTRHPELVVYSDLSTVGLAPLQARFGDRTDLVFAAIEAPELPLMDESLDLVYGFAFVHHLPEKDRFLAEVARVLKPGGRAVFMDNAYSPAWQKVKLSVLKPLMRLSHRREPRSPEDVKHTLAGGFQEEDLERRIRVVGGEPKFERVALTYYVWKRASISLFPEAMRPLPRHDLISIACRRLDEFLGRLPVVRRNMIRLIWGFEKPERPRALSPDDTAQSSTVAS